MLSSYDCGACRNFGGERVSSDSFETSRTFVLSEVQRAIESLRSLVKNSSQRFPTIRRMIEILSDFYISPNQYQTERRRFDSVEGGES